MIWLLLFLAFAMVFIVRWFHVVSVANQDWETTTEFVFERSARTGVSPPLLGSS